MYIAGIRCTYPVSARGFHVPFFSRSFQKIKRCHQAGRACLICAGPLASATCDATLIPAGAFQDGTNAPGGKKDGKRSSTPKNAGVMYKSNLQYIYPMFDSQPGGVAFQ